MPDLADVFVPVPPNVAPMIDAPNFCDAPWHREQRVD